MKFKPAPEREQTYTTPVDRHRSNFTVINGGSHGAMVGV